MELASEAILADDRKWFVIYTKSRSEKKVAEGLEQRGVEVFCPMLKTRRRWSDRFKWVEEPLFRSYCFVRLREKDRGQVFGVPGVVRYLFWLNKPAVVRDEEMCGLKQLLGTYSHEGIEVTAFNPSDKVRFENGPFGNVQGEVVRQRGDQVQLFIEALGMLVTVDMRSSRLELV